MKFRTLLLALSLSAASCVGTKEETAVQPAAETVRVTVGSGPRLDVLSRTTLGPDGRVDWQTDDRIALWAFDASGEAQLSQHPFRLWHYKAEYSEAKFTADIPAMPSGTYVYYATYPEPASVDGTLVGFDIPAVQDGAYHPDYDIMTACCTGPALQEGDNSDRIRFAFAHRIHLLKITVPTNLMGDRATAIELEFPQPVAGRLTLDASDPGAEPQLTESSSRLTLRFAEPIDAGTTVYAAIAPVAIPAEGTVSIRTYATTGESRTDTFAGRTFAAGHTTPIEYNIPEMEIRYTIVRFTLDGDGTSTLGEPVQRLTLSADGALFDNGEAQRTFERNDEGLYTMIFKEFSDQLSGKPITVAFDSEHAVVARSFTMPQLVAETTNDVAALTVPYLFEEDFSKITNLTDNHDNAGHGWTSDTTTDAIDLGHTNLTGWSGARTGSQANTAVRICCRTQSVFGGSTLYRYHGRLDSAPFGGRIKKTVPEVKVTFAYGGGRSGNTAIYPLAACGYTTTQGVINSKQDKDQNWYISDPKVIENLGVDNTYDSPAEAQQTMSYPIYECTSSHRLSWEVNSTGSISTSNANSWLYLYNIRVSIVTE